MRKLYEQAVLLAGNGRFKESIEKLEDILKSRPKDFKILATLGVINLQAGKVLESIKFLKSSLEIEPNQPEANFNLAAAHKKIGSNDSALDFYTKAISLYPDYANAYAGRGVILYEIEKFDMALSDFEKAFLLNPTFEAALLNAGVCLNILGQFERAIVCFNKVISLNQKSFIAYTNLGSCLNSLKEYDAAHENHIKAIALNPNYQIAYNNLGKNFNDLKRYGEALSSLEYALKLKPDYPEALSNRGIALLHLRRFDDALSSFEYALELKPDYPEAQFGLGTTCCLYERYDEALVHFDRAIILKPDISFLLGSLFYTKMAISDWSDFENQVYNLTDGIVLHKNVAEPLVILLLIENPYHQMLSAINYVKEVCPYIIELPCLEKRPRHQKIRIAYFSADFREHPVSYLTAELFELHNRDEFEVIAFSFGVDSQDNLRKRLESGFDQFIDVKDKTDQEIAILAREMEIDIAIDLGGFTQDSRTNIFAMRAAPIQLSYIGYLGTMGAEYFDYLIADPTIIPQNLQQYYSEKIVYLPSYQVNDSKREISNRVFTPEELGIPRNGFVFCCFNNIYKITPTTFDSWMRILNAVDDSVLFLLDANETATKNLKKEAKARGVSSDRLVFAKHLPLPEYLARYRIADLFLDTLPYNAGTTASDALRMGLPVLTQMGQSFASRMAASLLNAVGLPELITTTQEEYESLAISLAKNPVEIQKIKNKLAVNLPASDLYNTQKFTRNIEAAYRSMYQRYQNDLQTDHIYVD